ncbi:hypothetical protein [Mucilaginibacter sp.]|jgi:hypothetical protein|uniref:hypothetical protein n=1 Tax=Mucilaginibacter sp. TaxID=1882438 RepID=UPI003569B9C8
MKKIRAYTRPRPVIQLGDTLFFVDAQWLYFIEVANPENKIDMGEARSFKDHIELWYDPLIKNCYNGPIVETPPENILVYWFHSFSALDPVGEAAKLDELNPQWRVKSDIKLPLAEIAGRYFFVDKKYSCFYEVNNCWNSISFQEITCRKKAKGFFINQTYQNTAFPHEMAAASKAPIWPEHIVFAPINGGAKVHKIVNRYLRRNHKNR